MTSDTAPTLPTLLITPGEPAGIGPDVLLQWVASRSTQQKAGIIAIADPDLLQARADTLNLKIPFRVLKTATRGPAHGIERLTPNELLILPCKLAKPVTPGQLQPDNASYVLECLKQATELCLSGQADGIVTGPVQKSVINDAGIPFSGHTEYFAEHCARNTGITADPVMMLATPGLRVALVTTHLPLRAVADSITSEKLRYCLDVLHSALQNDFGISQPRIFVTGLNPHAGEGGHLGREETEIITPVLDECRAEGMRITGPLPADTLFTEKHLSQADAVLAMYHDQGLPVLKYKGFSRAVNITLGLPIIRTSVDHGTALDLAGTGKADTGSLEYAIDVAAQLAQSRQGNIVNNL